MTSDKYSHWTDEDLIIATQYPHRETEHCIAQLPSVIQVNYTVYLNAVC